MQFIVFNDEIERIIVNIKLYTLDNKFIKETNIYPRNFTGIAKYYNGSKRWYVGGKYHRLDGPAYEYYDEEKEWWIDDKRVTEEQCELLYSIMKLKGLL